MSALYSPSEKFEVVASHPDSRSCRNCSSTLFFLGMLLATGNERLRCGVDHALHTHRPARAPTANPTLRTSLYHCLSTLCAAPSSLCAAPCRQQPAPVGSTRTSDAPDVEFVDDGCTAIAHRGFQIHPVSVSRVSE